MKTRSITSHALRLVVLVPQAFALVACTSANEPSAPSGPPSAPEYAIQNTGLAHAPQLAPASGAIRQVSHRSPYGDVAATQNLLLDGDFEFEQDPSSSAWLLLNADGSFGTLAFESGGQCRSGLYCIAALAGQTVYGQEVSIPPGTAGTFTFAAKPTGACSDVQGQIDLGADPEGVTVDSFVAQPTSAQPGVDGWCTYQASYTADRPMYQWADVELLSASETIFDDVVVETVPSARAVVADHRAGDPAKGRILAAQRRAIAEVIAQKAAAVMNPRHRPGTRVATGR